MSQDNIAVWGIGTPRTFRVHWALHELQREYVTHRVQTRTPMMDEAEFLAVSPGKKIPALQHGDLTLTESAAITRYLMSSFSAAKWTLQQQALIDRFVFFSLMELDATAFYVIRRHEGLPALYGEAPTAVAAAYEYADRQLNVLAGLIGDQDYCVDNRFSEADIHVVSILDWAMLLKIDLPENLTRYLQRFWQRAAYQLAKETNSAT
ncbi:MAG: glutathione S-transferase family protein [Gammaproteobacteria bacterium]